MGSASFNGSGTLPCQLSGGHSEACLGVAPREPGSPAGLALPEQELRSLLSLSVLSVQPPSGTGGQDSWPGLQPLPLGRWFPPPQQWCGSWRASHVPTALERPWECKRAEMWPGLGWHLLLFQPLLCPMSLHSLCCFPPTALGQGTGNVPKDSSCHPFHSLLSHQGLLPLCSTLNGWYPGLN